MAVHVVPSLHDRHDELASARVVLRPPLVAAALTPEPGEARHTCRGSLLLRVRSVRVVLVTEQGARAFVPGHVTLTDRVVANRTCKSRVHARDHLEVFFVHGLVAHEQVLEVAAHGLTGLALVLVGLIDLGVVVVPGDSLRRKCFLHFGGRRRRILWSALFRMRVTWSAGCSCCRLLRRSPFEGLVLRRALLPAPHGPFGLTV